MTAEGGGARRGRGHYLLIGALELMCLTVIIMILRVYFKAANDSMEKIAQNVPEFRSCQFTDSDEQFRMVRCVEPWHRHFEHIYFHP